MDQVFEVVKDMRLCHVVRFLADPSIDYNMIANLVVLLSTYVTFDRLKHVNYQDNMFMSVPTNIVEFAYHSRIDRDYRLLKRCLRHSFDLKTGDLRNSTVKLRRSRSDGNLGFSFKHQIKASMKCGSYNIETIVSTDKILISKCTCKAG